MADWVLPSNRLVGEELPGYIGIMEKKMETTNYLRFRGSG